MSDADRALVGRDRWRTPSHGVPIHTPDADDFTPVGEVMALVDRISDNETRHLIGAIIAKTWGHTRNQELRTHSAIERTEGAQIREALDEHSAADVEHHAKVVQALADIHGVSGQNGKLGELRRRVDALSSKAWWLFTAFIGGLGAAAIKLVIVVRAFDAVAATADHNTARLLEQQARILRLETAAITRRYRPATPEIEREQP